MTLNMIQTSHDIFRNNHVFCWLDIKLGGVDIKPARVYDAGWQATLLGAGATIEMIDPWLGSFLDTWLSLLVEVYMWSRAELVAASCLLVSGSVTWVSGSFRCEHFER